MSTRTGNAPAIVAAPPNLDGLDAPLSAKPRDITARNFGLTTFANLFTNRQLMALTTFSDLVVEVRARVAADARAGGLSRSDSEEYSRGVAVYLASVVDRAADNWSSLASWHSGNGQLRNVFARQAIPMVWDFAEANPFSSSSVSWTMLHQRYPDAIARLGVGPAGNSVQRNATDVAVRGAVVATDPPVERQVIPPPEAL